jgi:thiol-disulfide isomerase/thioredoxin
MPRRCIKNPQKNYKANAENFTKHMTSRVSRREWHLIIGLLVVVLIGLIVSASFLAFQMNDLASSVKPSEKPCPIEVANATMNTTQKNYTLLFFMEDGCPFCQAQAPAIANLSLKHDVMTINLTSDPNGKSLAKQWNVTTTPTTIVLSNGNETTRFIGVTSEKTISASLL